MPEFKQRLDVKDLDQQDDVINFITSIQGATNNLRDIIRPNINLLSGKTTLPPREFCDLLTQALSKGDITHLWNTGMPCRVMRNGKPWQKGKMVISVEFIPDLPDDPIKTDELDELRP
jgi:hypothetical protein